MEVKRRELTVRAKDTFTAVQWFKHGDHPAVKTVPRGTSSYALPANCDVTTIGWLSDPTSPNVGFPVNPSDWIIGPFEDDDYEVVTNEEFLQRFEEIPTADKPAEKPEPSAKKGKR